MLEKDKSEGQNDPVARDLEDLIQRLQKNSELFDMPHDIIDAEVTALRQHFNLGVFHVEAIEDAARICEMRSIGFDRKKIGQADPALKSALEAEIEAVRQCGYPDQEVIDAEIWVLQHSYDYGYYQPGCSLLLRKRNFSRIQPMPIGLGHLQGEKIIPILIQQEASSN